ncbi:MULTISPECIES: P-loop NTPase fold protein [unclassified Mesorhizobium]|uniref:KAP family P-loop NTPase fold protein n=1 Tax=unclassified Mesorhizobium TaxID=325217 RepID=UPI0013E0C94C|nr:MULTISPECIES: P-loop NTPase fold protein [unclassified Mesorhizobium]
MSNEQKYSLGDDLPKDNPWQDDLLGYAPFAKMLFNAIRDLDAPNGYVIGLHGRWGSGKSTTINFVKAHINKFNEELEDQRNRIGFIDFRPWIVAGHQDLMASFFKVLTENLGTKDNWWKRQGKGFLRHVRGPADTLVEALATLGMAVDPTKVGAGFAGAMAKKSINGMIGRFLDEPSVQLAYEKLKLQLRNSRRRIVVAIDDLDRLEDHEVRSIMQMVKTVGQLPNVVYILSYDRQIVWSALDGNLQRSGPKYAEKIIQQEIELPQPQRHALLKILDREIAFLLATQDRTSRWEYLVIDGIHRWINSPRDVVKLANAVKMAWPTFKNEIDAQDLLAMEGLKLFDEAAFNWVRDNRDFLFSEGRFAMTGDEAKTAAVENLKRRYPDNERVPQILNVLSALFPGSAKWLGGNSISSEPYEDVMRRRGIGSKEGYETYFGWGLPKDSIPKSVIDALLANLDNSGLIANTLGQYLSRFNSKGEPMIGLLLDELRIRYRGRHPARPTQTLLDELFKIGEKVLAIDWEPPFLSLGPKAQIRFLIRNMLEAWQKGDAGIRLFEAFEKAQSAAFCATVFVDMGRSIGVFRAESGDAPLIEKDAFDKLGPILLSKILTAAAEGRLLSAPYYFDIARAWAYLATPAEPKAWLASGMQDNAEFMVKVGDGLTAHSVGAPVRTYSMRNHPEPELYDLEVLIEAGKKHLKNGKLDSGQRRMLEAIVNGSQRILAGQAPDSDWPVDDDDR